MEIMNCPNCGALFVKNPVRDVCENCYREEEKQFEKVYKFLRKKENRAATVQTISKYTGVKEELLYKWVKKGRLRPAQFPNLGYPCEKCGKIITQGKLCSDCVETIKKDLEIHELEQQNQDERMRRRIYHYQIFDEEK